MATWKWLLIINGSCLVGILVSLFVVPPRTPFWIWTTISVTALIFSNIVFFRRKLVSQPRKGRLWGDVVIGLGFLVLLVDFLLRYGSR